MSNDLFLMICFVFLVSCLCTYLSVALNWPSCFVQIQCLMCETDHRIRISRLKRNTDTDGMEANEGLSGGEQRAIGSTQLRANAMLGKTREAVLNEISVAHTHEA